MPELPEVEIFRQFAEQHAMGKRVAQVQVFTPKILKGVSTQALANTLKNQQVTTTERRGKQLLLGFSSQDSSKNAMTWLLVHFGMTGFFSVSQNEQFLENAYQDRTMKPSHIRVQFLLENDKALNFHEQRMFGHMGLIANPEAFFQEKKLGPDALTVTPDAWHKQSTRFKGAVKSVLLNQSFVAGIGNVYADEILFQARIHPKRAFTSLQKDALTALQQQTQTVLQNTVAMGADRDQLPAQYLWHTRKPKGKCPACKTTLCIETISGRTTYFCLQCQV